MKFHVITLILSVVSMVTKIYCAPVNDAKPQLTAWELGEFICNATDTNNDGIFTKLEWGATLAIIDINHNDEVTASEYVRYFMKASSVLKITWIHALFQLGDFSNDGVLTMADIDQIVSLDIDGDGFVSDEECIEACAMILKKYDPELE
ncbi:uncharacterized protein LOC106156474 isoform X2 [Lingula anatina]|uniref:Uncharacterized protein LOC106156474 isoform X2 n=1 Tax=Lingula anatina TaxID=7574 RepID=A0A1S3HME2_LINAN|nr:uncharacterized protein LOC106156474 isoform X2 [Lingula anatina]|eukprot:XP_013387192.1 uncharacterized protein LOC106156474 isoform X2 [Lingula anatina]